MKIFLRLLLLLGCGAAGVGLACYLAMTLDSAPTTSPERPRAKNLSPVKPLPATVAKKQESPSPTSLAKIESRSNAVRPIAPKIKPIVQQPAPPRTRQVTSTPNTQNAETTPEVLPPAKPYTSAFTEPPTLVPPAGSTADTDADVPANLFPPMAPAAEIGPPKNQLRLTTEAPTAPPAIQSPTNIQRPQPIASYPPVTTAPAPAPAADLSPPAYGAELVAPSFPASRQDATIPAPPRDNVPNPPNLYPDPNTDNRPRVTIPSNPANVVKTRDFDPNDQDVRPLPTGPGNERVMDEEDERPMAKPPANNRRDYAGKAGVNRTPGFVDGSQHLDIVFPETDIRDALEQLSDQAGLNILATSSVQGTVSAVLKDVDVQGALDAILKSTGYVAKREGRFIYVGTPQDFTAMDTALDKIGIHIYRPNYVSSKDLQMLLTPLLTPSVGKISVTTPSEVGIATNANNAGGYSLATGEAVVVQDYENVLAELDQVVKELDKRPLQVAIEAMMLSVSLKDENKFGVDFQLLRNVNNVRLGSGQPSPAPLGGGGQTDPITGAPLGAFPFDTGGLKFAFLDSSLAVFITALETIGDTNVIAKPRLMCLNKQRAEILIGSQLGYVNTTLTETSTAQNVQFLEVGAQLRLRPFISSDGMIRMEIHPEISTGSVQVQGGFTLPQKDLTQVTTNIMCPDGHTVIIGGLIREDLTTTTSQVPLVGSLPVIGPLFRSKDEVIQRREIVILVTPRIVYDEENCVEGSRASNEYNRRQSVYVDQMSPVGKRYLGRQYFRKAQEQWAAGDTDCALRAVQLAIHFDPVSRPAIELRSDITHGIHRDAPMAGHNLTFDLHPLDSPRMAPWLLDDLQEERPNVQRKPPHPWDPGQPGSQKNIQRPGIFQDAR